MKSLRLSTLLCGVGVCGLLLATSLATAALLENHKCTFGNYPPQCMCPVPNSTPVDRCAAGVPKAPEHCAYNTECGWETDHECDETQEASNACGTVYVCFVNCDEWCPGATHGCYEKANKPQCTGTWGRCPLEEASW